ncbi:Lipid-A-disaccharide synthase [hydrothermal vent metagenome]|uniref:lipid-A-disaccharide synthase n=1 Tax=hydrothermal vent metagenome TaxID=652676 RepID=A0A3B1DTG5_9ZZZZ
MKLLVSAVEPSSNKYLKQIATHLSDTKLIGLGDKNIIKQTLYPVEDFSIMGIASVLPKIFFLKRAIDEMVELSKDAKAVLLIDAPSFNLKIAKKIKQKYPDKPIFYYILPKIWAWKKSRIELVEKYTDYHISILPFEHKFYPNALYFGNPLFDEYTKTNIDFSKNKYIAFLPGSRKSEIKSLLPIFKKMAKKINASFDNTKALLVIPDIFDTSYVDATYGNLKDFEIISDTKKAMSLSKFAFVCAGTATLEASLFGVPFTLCYTPRGIDWAIYFLFFKILDSSGLGKMGNVGLANIIAHFENKKPIHKEAFPIVDEDILWDIYDNFDYKEHYNNIDTLREIMNKRNNKKTNSLKQIANFILDKTL